MSAETHSEQLAAIERRLENIEALLLHAKPVQQSRWVFRWRPSLRSLLLVTGILAALAAWVGAEMRSATLRMRAARLLASQGVVIQAAPADSLLVAMMPGTPSEPPAVLQRWLGNDIFSSFTTVMLDGRRSRANYDWAKIEEAIQIAPRIREVHIQNCPLRTEDLAPFLALPQLEGITTRHCGLSDNHLPEIRSTALKRFDGAHTWLGDRAAADLSACSGLTHLTLDRTRLTDAGLEHLKKLKNLKQLSILRTRVSPAAIKKFSDVMPDCYIIFQSLPLDSEGNALGGSISPVQTFGTPEWNGRGQAYMNFPHTLRYRIFE